MASPDTILGAGMAALAVSAPVIIAVLRYGKKSSNGSVKAPDNLVDDPTCEERREAAEKLVNAQFAAVRITLKAQDKILDRLETTTTKIFDKLDNL